MQNLAGKMAHKMDFQTKPVGFFVSFSFFTIFWKPGIYKAQKPHSLFKGGFEYTTNLATANPPQNLQVLHADLDVDLLQI